MMNFIETDTHDDADKTDIGDADDHRPYDS